MVSFSERSGYIKPSGAIIVECMPKEVRIYRRIMKLSLCLYFIYFYKLFKREICYKQIKFVPLQNK